MSRTIHKTDTVALEGFQAVLEPSKFGYSLAAVVGQDVIDTLETERGEVLKWAESKLKNQGNRQWFQSLVLSKRMKWFWEPNQPVRRHGPVPNRNRRCCSHLIR